jgi:microcystin-dependent protein
MSQPYIGQILAVGFNFAPPGWNACDGSLLAISQNEALFNLIGTTYGGDGVSNFALPDLRGRVLVHQGQGPNLSNRSVGQSGGSETVTLATAQMPTHTHNLNASESGGSTATPGPSVSVASNVSPSVFGPAPGNTTLAPTAISATGGNLEHENRQPFIVLNYIISTEGVFPSQG